MNLLFISLQERKSIFFSPSRVKHLITYTMVKILLHKQVSSLQKMFSSHMIIADSLILHLYLPTHCMYFQDTCFFQLVVYTDNFPSAPPLMWPHLHVPQPRKCINITNEKYLLFDRNGHRKNCKLASFCETESY